MSEDLKILQLVTNRGSGFFKRQVEYLEQCGVECDVVGVSIGGPENFREGSSHYPDRVMSNQLLYTIVASLSFYLRMLWALRRDYDLVHVNSGKTLPLVLAQPRRPIVVTLWGSDVMNEGIHASLTKRSLGRCCRVIAMSAEMKELIDREATVIPYGVDLELFENLDQRDAQAELEWDQSATHVLFPYDPSRSVKRYSLAEETVEEVRDRIKKEVVLHAVYNQPHDRMPTFYNAADCLLLTSSREGSPNSVKEALACNLPVVAMDVGDVDVQLAGTELSSVCSRGEELVSSLETVLQSDTRSNGREVAREMSSRTTAESILEIYEECLDDR